jgi:hypothetical protein
VCSLEGVCAAPESQDASSSALVSRLLASTSEHKEEYDADRLDRYYNRRWRINELLGREVLPEPCDPRTDSDKCGVRPLPGPAASSAIEGAGGRVYVE